ncbi:alpha/beta hydrolase fold domain-containing protein [Streptomyces sp. M19]
MGRPARRGRRRGPAARRRRRGSAGGGLTAALALLARDRAGLRWWASWRCAPCSTTATTRCRHASWPGAGCGTGAPTRWAGPVCWAPRPGRRGVRVRGPGPRDGPVRAAPAFLDAGAAETFRDETVTYATRIWRAGGDAELHIWSGGFHGFDQLVQGAAVSRDAREARVRWLRRVLGR